MYPAIVDFENLCAAAYRARRGERLRPDVAGFHLRLEEELFDLRRELMAGVYQPGPCGAFHICDPKRRLGELVRAHAAGGMELDRMRASILGWIGHQPHGDTRGPRGKLLSAAVFGAARA